jgi:hypothetical protein
VSVIKKSRKSSDNHSEYDKKIDEDENDLDESFIRRELGSQLIDEVDNFFSNYITSIQQWFNSIH